MISSNQISFNVSGNLVGWSSALLDLPGEEKALKQVVLDANFEQSNSASKKDLGHEDVCRSIGIVDSNVEFAFSDSRWVKVWWKEGVLVCSSYNREATKEIEYAGKTLAVICTSIVLPTPESLDVVGLLALIQNFEQEAIGHLKSGRQFPNWEKRRSELAESINGLGTWDEVVTVASMDAVKLTKCSVNYDNSELNDLIYLIKHCPAGDLWLSGDKMDLSDLNSSLGQEISSAKKQKKSQRDSERNSVVVPRDQPTHVKGGNGQYGILSEKIPLLAGLVLMLILGCGAFFFLNDEGHCTDETACNYGRDEVDCLYEDECGVCGGPGAVYDCGCTGVPDGACDCQGRTPLKHRNCEGQCLSDEDADGVCDQDEVPGCTDQKALNFNPAATDRDASCKYSKPATDNSGVTEKAPEAPRQTQSSSQESVPQEQALLFCQRLNGEVDGFYVKPQTDAMRPILIEKLLEIEQWEDEEEFDEFFKEITKAYKAWSSKELMLGHLCLFTSLKTSQRKKFIEALGKQCFGHNSKWKEVKKSFEKNNAELDGRFKVPKWCNCEELKKQEPGLTTKSNRQ